MDPFKLQLIMEKGKIDLAARAGDLATSDISIPAGNTGIPPGPVLSEFKSVDVDTRIETGSIFVARDTVVAKRGDEITIHLAGLLSRLNIKPIKAGLSVDSAYMGGLIFHADDISINLDSYRAEIISSFQSALALGVEQSYMTSETTPLIIAKAFRSARGLSVTSGFFTKETVDEIILLDHMKAVSLSNTIESKGYSAE